MPMEIIKACINRVIYYNDTNGYAVVSVLINEVIDGTISKSLDKITVVGSFPRLPLEDENYTIRGELIHNERYGEQIKLVSFVREDPDSAQAVISYLCSDIFKGVGPQAASVVVKSLGPQALSIIRKNPDILDGVSITPKQREAIKTGIINDEQNQSATLFLLDHGITFDMSHKIIKCLEKMNVPNIEDTIKENPYMLIDSIDRFGFKKADALALDLGIDHIAPIRLHAALRYVLKELIYSTGNTYVYQNELIDAMRKYLNEPIENQLLEQIINEAWNDNEIYIDINHRIFDKYLYQFEMDLAKEVALFLLDKRNRGGIKKYPTEKINDALSEIIEDTAFELSEKQIEAIKEAFVEPIVIITGGPGSGKTTIVQAIIQMYLKINNNNKQLLDYIGLIAPTGRAAKRLNEATLLPTSTIHRYLGYQGEGHFEHNSIDRTDSKLVIVDEASMMDIELASRLLTSLDSNARIIIVGDVDQLPSVGPGQVLKDLIDTNIIKTIRLDKIHRQAEGSSIISLAHNINSGFLPNDILEKKEDRVFLNLPNEKISQTVVDCYMAYINKGNSIKDIEVLVPMYKGISGINELNNLIQERINPLIDEELIYFNNHYRIGDKVIQLINRANDGIMNGDIGYVKSFEHDNGKINKLIVEFDTYNIEYKMEDLDQIALAYAISIHKSQGSEFKTVVIPFSTSHFIMLKRKLIYTACTRAKEKLVMIGNIQSMYTGISRIETNRNTILKDKIIEFVNSYQKNNNKNNAQEEDPLGAEEIEF